MSNYSATSRSNYFKVKNKEKFKELCDRLEVKMIERDDLVGFISKNEDGSLPYTIYNPETEDWEDISICQEIALHLCKGQVAVMVESGAEKHRYIGGYAMAVNSDGEEESINIDQIYDLAKKLGKNVTKAEY